MLNYLGANLRQSWVEENPSADSALLANVSFFAVLIVPGMC